MGAKVTQVLSVCVISAGRPLSAGVSIKVRERSISTLGELDAIIIPSLLEFYSRKAALPSDYTHICTGSVLTTLSFSRFTTNAELERSISTPAPNVCVTAAVTVITPTDSFMTFQEMKRT